MFVRGETQSKSVLEAEKETTVNPDAIDLDDDDSDEEDSEDQSDKEDNGEPVAKKVCNLVGCMYVSRHY